GAIGWSLHRSATPASAGAAPASATVAADALPAATPVDPAMHAAAPLSAADRWLEQARAQVEAGHLALPPGENASHSLILAARAPPQLAATAADVLAALGEAAAKAIADDREADLDLLLPAAARIHGSGAADDGAHAAWRERIAAAMEARVAAAARRVDRPAALRVVDLAAAARLPTATVERLRSRAGRIPDLQGRDPGDLDGMQVLEGTTPPLAAFVR